MDKWHSDLYKLIEYVRDEQVRNYAELIDDLQDRGKEDGVWQSAVEHYGMICAYLDAVRRAGECTQPSYIPVS